jgi:DNA-3-methyladenine glycosylase II
MDYAIALTTLQESDPILGRLIERVGACTLHEMQHHGELLDSLSRSIIYQQLSTKSATAIYKRFLHLYKDISVETDHLDTHRGIETFRLTPEAILNTPDEILRSVGISRPKIAYLKDLAQKVSDGLPTIVELELLDDDTIIQTLTPIKGIGKWTVQMLLIFRLHRWDVLPVDDLGVRSGIRRLYELAELPDKKTVERLGQHWKPYRSIASWYFWRSLDLK